MDGVAFRHLLGDVAGLLVCADFSDATNVALILAERFGYEELNKVEDFILGVLTGANRDHIRIIVLASKLGG